MKKIFLFLAACAMSIATYAAVNITINPNMIDFGTIELNDEGEAEVDTTATLNWSGLTAYSSVYMDTIGAPAADADYEFRATKSNGSDFWYIGDEWNPADDPTVYIDLYAIAPGEYTITYNFYGYATEDDWYYETNKAGNATLVLKAKVVEKGGGTTTGVSQVPSDLVPSTKVLRNGQVMIIRNGETYTVMGIKVQQ